MKDKIKLSFSAIISEGLMEDLNKYGQRVCQYIASTGRDVLAARYENIIDRFYREYTRGDDSRHQEDDFYETFPYPLYIRHHDRGLNLSPGLNLTFRKYYRNPHNTIYRGGIIIDSEKMYNDYHADNDVVLKSFLDGYHGPEFMGIHKGTFPLKEILEFRDIIRENINEYFGAAANRYAASFSYKILRTWGDN